jgi:hypothetical protein
MGDFNIIYLLAGVTLVLALAIGFYQMRRAREAKRNHEHSALTEVGEAPHKMHR